MALPHEPRPVLLDLGCGPGLLLDYLRATGRLETRGVRGIDLSPAMVAAARARWPDRDISCRDVVTNPLPEQSVDFVIMNGVLTEKQTLSHEVMAGIAKELIVAAFTAARVGIAFNAMSRHVDWQRPRALPLGIRRIERLPPRACQPALCVPIGLWPLRADHVRLAGAATSAGASAWLVHRHEAQAGGVWREADRRSVRLLLRSR